MNLEEKIAAVQTRLEQAALFYGHGTDDGWDESTWMVLYVLGFDRASVLDNNNFDWQRVLNQPDLAAIDHMVEKRIQTRTPFAYLANQTWFAGNKFYIDRRAIIPRSYLSEWIPDAFQPWVDANKVHSVLDLCTGCGCIAISCALVFPQATVLASDLSTQALEVAGINIDNYRLGERVKLNHGDGFEGINEQFDLIVCNPPYVSDERMDRLPPEYCHEPDSALRGGRHGLDFMTPMLRQVENYLTNEGTLIVEAGSASHALEERYPTIPFTWLSTAYDEMVLFTLSARELRKQAAILSANR